MRRMDISIRPKEVDLSKGLNDNIGLPPKPVEIDNLLDFVDKTNEIREQKKKKKNTYRIPMPKNINEK